MFEVQDPAVSEFGWRSVPTDDEWLAPRDVIEYLSLTSEMKASQELEHQIRGWDTI